MNLAVNKSTAPDREAISYQRIKDDDQSFKLPNGTPLLNQLPQVARDTLLSTGKNLQLSIRVTRDSTTKLVRENGMIMKIKLANMHVLQPLYDFDWRISVNLEVPYTGTLEDIAAVYGGQADGDYQRMKNRVSYKHLKNFSLDLTQIRDQVGLLLVLSFDTNL